MKFAFWRRRRSLQSMLDAVALCGISLRAGASPELLLRPRSRWEAERSHDSIEKGGFQSLLIAMGDDRYDPAIFRPINPPSDDIWHFDVEFIEGHGAYKTIVDRLCRMGKGDLAFDQVKDYVDVEGKIAWLELTFAGTTERIDLTVDDDWVDPKIFSEMQRRLAATGSARRFAVAGLGQDCLIVCQPPEDIKALNRLTKLRFQITT